MIPVDLLMDRVGGVSFFVPGQPVGKGRPRVKHVGKHAQLYTPKETVSYENLVATLAHQAMAGRALFQHAVEVELRMLHQVPASWSGKRQREALNGLIVPTTKPDMDNVMKALFDAMNGVVWRDDVLVADAIVRRRYATNPGLDVVVRPWRPALEAA